MKWLRFMTPGSRSPLERNRWSLGPLEIKVIDAVAALEKTNVRNIVEALDNRFAYTTIMTTVDRLFKKGYLDREMNGRAYFYSLRVTQEEMRLGALGEVLAGLLDDATRSVEPILASIVNSVGSKDRALLDELERLVKEKKASIENK